MELKLLFDSNGPVGMFRAARAEGIEALRRELRGRRDRGPEAPHETPLLGSGVDFAITLDERPLAGVVRETVVDAVQSLMPYSRQNRELIFTRLQRLGRFPMKFLILEGRFVQNLRHLEPAIYGVMYWCYRNGIFVLHTPDMGGTATAVIVLFRRLQISRAEADCWKA